MYLFVYCQHNVYSIPVSVLSVVFFIVLLSLRLSCFWQNSVCVCLFGSLPIYFCITWVCLAVVYGIYITSPPHMVFVSVPFCTIFHLEYEYLGCEISRNLIILFLRGSSSSSSSSSSGSTGGRKYRKKKSSLTFRHCASCILGQAFHYSPENAFYIFNQQIYFVIWYLLDRASLL